jgi:hypothetical protein
MSNDATQRWSDHYERRRRDLAARRRAEVARPQLAARRAPAHRHPRRRARLTVASGSAAQRPSRWFDPQS